MFEDFEEKSAELEKRNDEYLDIFDKELSLAGLSDKVINRHISNVNFYLNTFLIRYEMLSMEEGTSYIGVFLGDFFIRKCMWSTPASVKSTAASIKKFYKCMLKNGKIDKDAYDSLCYEIKECLPDWMEDCAQYNDPDTPSPFSFF